MKSLDKKLRELQKEALSLFNEQYVTSGKKFCAIEAPTGSGKSLLSFKLWKSLEDYYNKKMYLKLVTSTIQLQNQYKKDFPEVNDCFGKENYICRKNKSTCGEGILLNKANKTTCPDCPYHQHVLSWSKGTPSVSNAHFMMGMSMYTEYLEENADVLVIDEAHLFEQVVLQYISTQITQNILDYVGYPYSIENMMNKIDDIYEFAEFIVKEFKPFIVSELEYLKNLINEKSAEISEVKKYYNLDQLLCKINRFLDDEENWKSNWIFEKNQDSLQCSPIFVGDLADTYIYSKFNHVIFLSGTIRDISIFSRLVGINKEDTVYLELDSDFSNKNRPIVYLPVGKMTYSEKNETWPKMMSNIEQIINHHKGQKGIIHTHSYEILAKLKNSYKGSRVIFDDNRKEKETRIKSFKSSKNDLLIASPSMITGIDLPDDYNRFQLILKVPFPDLKSKLIKRKMEIFPEWYQWQTCLDLIQAWGRGMRHHSDWCVTYILDESLETVLKRSGKYLPKYFLDSFIKK